MWALLFALIVTGDYHLNVGWMTAVYGAEKKKIDFGPGKLVTNA